MPRRGPREIDGHKPVVVENQFGEPVEIRIGDEVRVLTVKAVWKKCGNPRCEKCPHGPYAQGSYSWKGRTRTIHLGRMDRPNPPNSQVQRSAYELLLNHVRTVLRVQGGGRMPRGKVADIIAELGGVRGQRELARSIEIQLREEARSSGERNRSGKNSPEGSEGK